MCMCKPVSRTDFLGCRMSSPQMNCIIDGRDLIPPEPLERTLTALDTLADGEELLLLLYCQPKPLLDILNRNGYRWQESVRDDGTHEIRIYGK